MNMISSFRWFAIGMVAVCLSASASQAVTLDVWNVDQLYDSDDYIDLQFGVDDGHTTLTIMWVGGADDTPGAIGIDKLFINNSDITLQVEAVYVNSIMLANDVTGSWLPSMGGLDAGGGFGLFVEKQADSGGNDGVDPNSLIFVLDGIYAEGSFVPNSDGASFAAHVRYGNECSGWVADGGEPGNSGPDRNCGDGSTIVPEPSAALVFGVGFLLLRSRVRKPQSVRI